MIVYNKKKVDDNHRLFYVWWGRRDSNSHTSRRQNLNLVRLPISPRPQVVYQDNCAVLMGGIIRSFQDLASVFFKHWINNFITNCFL